MRKIISILALILALGIFSGCGASKGTEPPADEVTPASFTVTDMTGREVTLEKPAERIVALTSGDCEILYAIGAGDRLVGRGEYCNYPEEALEVPAVASGSETNLEQIIALNPDLVLMSTMDQSQEQVEALEEAGIAVALSRETGIEGAYELISVIGALTGMENEAEAVIGEMKSTFEELSAKSSDKEGGTVYFEVSPLEWGLWTAGTNTYMDEIASMLGLENIFADVDGWAEVTEEQVIDRDPDYIVTITMYYGEGPTPVEEIMGRTAWQDITAVKNGSVLNANSDEIARPGPRLAKAAAALYDFVYGE